MKRKGFTLIELLAVIVILAVIALIATPLVLNVIERSKKGAFESSAYGIIESIEYYYANSLLDEKSINGDKSFSFPNNELTFKGSSPISGEALLTYDGKVDIAIFDGTWCAKKTSSEDKVKLLKLNASECRLSVEAQNRVRSLSIIRNTDKTIYYKGENPSNYVMFNHDLWRIISVSDGKMRLVKNNAIATLRTDVDINGLLNDYYESMPSIYKNLIIQTEVKAGTVDYNESSTYDSLLASSNMETLNSYISLMNPTDYIFGSNNSSCADKPYNNNACKNQNWLSLLNGNILFQNSKLPDTRMLFLSSGSFMTEDEALVTYDIYPTITLNNNVFFQKGSGTKEDPYYIHVEEKQPLEDCQMHGTKCVFKGENPNNYIIFNSQVWRILSIEGNLAKIVAPTSFQYEWDADNYNDWSRSTLKDYLNTTWYDTLLASAKENIVSYDYNIGTFDDINRDPQLLEKEQNLDIWNGKVGIINPTDYIYTSASTSCSSYPFTNCGTSNWLGKEALWTLNTLSTDYTSAYVTAYMSSPFGMKDASSKEVIKPVVVIDISKGFSKGKGSAFDPYYLK